LYQFYLYKKYVDYVVFQCPYAARRFVGGGWLLDHNRGGYIPLGVEAFSEELMTTRPTEAVGCPDIRELLEEKGWFNFVYLAEIRPGKGQSWLLDALRPVLEKNPKARMFFLGGGRELLDAFRLKVAGYGLENQVICPGVIPRQYVPWVLAHCNAGLIPTRSETFGHCFSEPAMAGIPILGTRVGAGEYLIQDMVTGIGFTYGNSEALRESAQFFISHKEDVKKMGETLRDAVKTEFLHEKIANAYMMLYARLLAK
jgi:glycosyltransferase involved in cell wall biosynthesis